MVMNEDYISIDGSNIAHRTYFAHQQQAGNDISGVALHYALTTFNKVQSVFTNYHICAFDNLIGVRCTQSGKCLTKAVYK